MESYSAAMKSKMVQRMLGPEKRSLTQLSSETGISQSSLYKWKVAAKVGGMKTGTKTPTEAKRPEDWTAAEKLAAVIESRALTDEGLGAFLRNKGLHEAQVAQWEERALAALSPTKAVRGASSDQRRVRDLEKELRRKDKALAEAAALLILQKKAQAIWGDVDDDTNSESGAS
jgi:transposase